MKAENTDIQKHVLTNYNKGLTLVEIMPSKTLQQHFFSP